MNSVRETLVNLLFNAFLQIGLFAIVAACFSRLLRKARAKHQYVIYLAVFFVCVTAPVVNTFWKSYPIAPAEHSAQQIPSEFGKVHRGFWSWQVRSAGQRHFKPGNRFKVGSSVYGACLFCTGWLALASVFIAFIGFGGTRQRFLLK